MALKDGQTYKNQLFVCAVLQHPGEVFVLYTDSEVFQDEVSNFAKTWELKEMLHKENVAFDNRLPENPGIYKWVGTIVDETNTLQFQGDFTYQHGLSHFRWNE